VRYHWLWLNEHEFPDLPGKSSSWMPIRLRLWRKQGCARSSTDKRAAQTVFGCGSVGEDSIKIFSKSEIHDATRKCIRVSLVFKLRWLKAFCKAAVRLALLQWTVPQQRAYPFLQFLQVEVSWNSAWPSRLQLTALPETVSTSRRAPCVKAWKAEIVVWNTGLREVGWFYVMSRT